MKKKLQMMKQKKLTLSAEVRYELCLVNLVDLDLVDLDKCTIIQSIRKL